MNLKDLSYKRKNQLLLIGMLLVLFVSWKFAFKNTFDAIELNGTLNVKNEDAQNLSYNAPYMAEKSFLLDSLVSKYTVDSANWKNSFWMNVSRTVSSLDGINVVYQPDDKLKDQEELVSLIERQQITFEADYKKMVVLLDSLKTKSEAGFINSVSFNTKKTKRSDETELVRMKVVFSVIKK